MQVGIHLPHIGRKASPDAIRRAAIQAEDLGFDDVWVSEHIIVPKDGGYPPSANFWDPVRRLAGSRVRRARRAVQGAWPAHG
jgi:alkanesulfonate monooxygenase SsuD/methylene tetrahydromethanopterin reductase-like flavin-dependent oxidoreductase (luciferase family)